MSSPPDAGATGPSATWLWAGSANSSGKQEDKRCWSSWRLWTQPWLLYKDGPCSEIWSSLSVRGLWSWPLVLISWFTSARNVVLEPGSWEERGWQADGWEWPFLGHSPEYVCSGIHSSRPMGRIIEKKMDYKKWQKQTCPGQMKINFCL